MSVLGKIEMLAGAVLIFAVGVAGGWSVRDSLSDKHGALSMLDGTHGIACTVKGGAACRHAPAEGADEPSSEGSKPPAGIRFAHKMEVAPRGPSANP